jgi:chitinase
VGDTQDLTATVTNAPNNAVTWSVVEGSAGGTVNNSGRYIAPAVRGTYHVKATSVYDTTKSATATITVQSGSVNGTIQ